MVVESDRKVLVHGFTSDRKCLGEGFLSVAVALIKIPIGSTPSDTGTVVVALLVERLLRSPFVTFYYC